MNNKQLPTLFLRTLLLFAACTAYSLQAAGLQPVFHFSTASSEPVIEYNLVHHMLAQPDPVPLLRVYGNGRVDVHFPAYMKRAGNYELYMKPSQLNELLRRIADDGIMGFDKATAMQEKHQLEAARRAATGEVVFISDATDTVINIRLKQYQRSPSSPRIDNFSKNFRWRNLEQDAIRFPASGTITRAAAAAAMLQELCEHPGLQKLH